MAPVSASGTPTARQIRGAQAEARALEHLALAGLRLLARNVRYKGGELDLVMRDGAVLVFVEVRQRSSSAWGGAAASIDARKRGRIIHAAQLYLRTFRGGREPPCRFDVVLIDGGDLSWIPNAFDTTSGW